jgi:signal peptidase I
LDFDLTDVWQKTFFPQASRIVKPEHYHLKKSHRSILETSQIVFVGGENCLVPEVSRKVKKGELLLNFDVLTGDMLFVDRMSYNFVDPARGDTFVFRTNNIPGLRDQFGQPSQNYYVKRLAGVPGQKLRVGDRGELFVDGNVVTSPEPMVLNSRQDMDKGYYGYIAEVKNNLWPATELSLQQEYTVTPGHYYAMGDNSANSFDSRGWGEVPAKDVVGKPLFILHPFTSHWGPAK